MRAILALLTLASGLAGQTYTLGSTASDPCAGGSPYVLAATPAPAIATLRYSAASFSCTFQGAQGAGAYVVKLEFVEPNVTAPAARLFHVYANDQQILANLDLYASGATDQSKIVTRTALVVVSPTPIASDPQGLITLRLQTVVRSAVLSRVTLTPFAAAVGQVSLTVSGLTISLGKPVQCTITAPQAGIVTFASLATGGTAVDYLPDGWCVAGVVTIPSPPPLAIAGPCTALPMTFSGSTDGTGSCHAIPTLAVSRLSPQLHIGGADGTFFGWPQQ